MSKETTQLNTSWFGKRVKKNCRMKKGHKEDFKKCQHIRI